MKILHIIFTLNVGGAETMLVDIANEQSMQDDVTMCIIDDSINENLLNSICSRVKVIKMGRKSGSKSIMPFIMLNWLLLINKPDVIHIHNWQTPRVLLPCFKPFFTVHGLDRPATYYNRLKGLIAISEAVKKDVMRRGNFPVTVIPNGIVTDGIKQKAKLEKNSSLRIVQVGRLRTELKGQDLLVDAIAKLKERNVTNVMVDIIGEGESRSELIRQIEQVGLQNQIHLLGGMSRQKLYESLCEYDLLCQPSRKEGFGLTVAEAMAACVPVLVSNAGGPYEIIEGSKLGYSFETENSVSCADAIQSIMDCYGDSEMVNKTEEAYKKAMKEYSISQMVRQYRAYYLERNR